MAYSDHLSPDQFPSYRSAYGRAQEIGKHLPPVAGTSMTSHASERRAVLRHLSRSSIPASHLSGLSIVIPDSREAQEEHGEDSAMYDRDTKAIHTGFVMSGSHFYNRGRENQADIQHALVHEVGHHQTSKGQNFGGEGAQEALAENYAEKYRSPRYSYQPSVYDRSYRGDRSRNATEYRKIRKSKEQPRGYGEI